MSGTGAVTSDSVACASRVGIVGGGLGGLALAQFLRRAGVPCTVYERDVSGVSREQGYAIGLIPATLKLFEPYYDAIPLLKSVLTDPRNSHSEFKMVDTTGATVMAMTGDMATGQFVYRPALRSALLAGIDVRWGKALASYTERDDDVVLSFADGTQATHEIVIGADGANSVLRRTRAPAITYNDLGFTNVAGVLPFDAAPALLRDLSSTGLCRTLGPDGYTLMCMQYRGEAPVGHVLLWSLSHPGAQKDWAETYSGPGSNINDEYDEAGARRREELRNMYAGQMRARFRAEFADVVAATPAASLFGPRQVYSVDAEAVPSQILPGPTRVYLLGDAAHATTTHMGMGANTAFRDAADIAAALTSSPSPTAWLPALKAYEVGMVKRGVEVVTNSRRSTGMIHATGFFGSHGRYWLMKTMGFLMRYAPWMVPKRA